MPSTGLLRITRTYANGGGIHEFNGVRFMLGADFLQAQFAHVGARPGGMRVSSVPYLDIGFC